MVTREKNLGVAGRVIAHCLLCVVSMQPDGRWLINVPNVEDAIIIGIRGRVSRQWGRIAVVVRIHVSIGSGGKVDLTKVRITLIHEALRAVRAGQAAYRLAAVVEAARSNKKIANGIAPLLQGRLAKQGSLVVQ